MGVAAVWGRGTVTPHFSFWTKQGPPVSVLNIKDIALYGCSEITRFLNCMLRDGIDMMKSYSIFFRGYIVSLQTFVQISDTFVWFIFVIYAFKIQIIVSENL